MNMFKKGIVLCVAIFLVCICIEGYAQEKSLNRIVSERLIAQIDFSSWIQESFKVSPDSRRVAYMAQEGNKQFVVVDGKEEKKYDGIGEGTLIFSPDSRRVAYVAQEGNKWVVVVDGKEEKKYDGIVTLGGGRVIFDSPDSLHYLAIEKGNKIYLVEEAIK
jgi:dipeptidyl aminopeptidase/acylaminoacyl peptidase